MDCLSVRKWVFTGLAGGILLAGGQSAIAAEDEHAGHDMSGGMDHSGHDMSGHSAERDELGRRLHGMKHQMSPEVMDQFCSAIRCAETSCVTWCGDATVIPGRVPSALAALRIIQFRTPEGPAVNR